MHSLVPFRFVIRFQHLVKNQSRIEILFLKSDDYLQFQTSIDSVYVNSAYMSETWKGQPDEVFLTIFSGPSTLFL